MKQKLVIAFLIAAGLAAAGLAVTPAPSFAGKHEDHERARQALLRGEVLPLTRILELTARHVPGEVIKLELESKKKRLYYEIKVLTPDGRVREVYLDARSGALIAIEDD